MIETASILQLDIYLVSRFFLSYKKYLIDNSMIDQESSKL